MFCQRQILNSIRLNLVFTRKPENSVEASDFIGNSLFLEKGKKRSEQRLRDIENFIYSSKTGHIWVLLWLYFRAIFLQTYVFYPELLDFLLMPSYFNNLFKRTVIYAVSQPPSFINLYHQCITLLKIFYNLMRYLWLNSLFPHLKWSQKYTELGKNSKTFNKAFFLF